ncbi:MAG: terminase, partial [Proteobacteria bacterium]|nr:terminase [Pseudomonadota bacterium]
VLPPPLVAKLQPMEEPMSLMRHWQKTFKDAGATSDTPKRVLVVGGTINQQQLLALIGASLSEDMKALGEIKSVEAKADLKGALIPKYADYVARLRAEDWQHELLTTYMIWLFDIGRIEAALELGLYCVRKDIPMPERFTRETYVVVADSVLEWAVAEFEADRSPEPFFSTVFGFVDGMNSASPWDLPDKLRAKFYRLAGLLEDKAGRLEAAEACLIQAAALGAQVKTKLGAVQKSLDEKTN